MIRTTERRSRKHRVCGCGNGIHPGDRYMEHVAAPGHDDLGNTRWWRLPECEECATRYGRMTAEITGGGESLSASAAIGSTRDSEPAASGANPDNRNAPALSPQPGA